MKNSRKKRNRIFQQWKIAGRHVCPSTVLESLRSEVGIWSASVVPIDEMGVQFQYWGYTDRDPLPEIIVTSSKAETPIKCSSKLLAGCLKWFHLDPQVVSYSQPDEGILMNFDGVEYWIDLNLKIQRDNGEIWLLNLMDTTTEYLCKKKPLLLGSIEEFCESMGCKYFPLRDEDFMDMAISDLTSSIDDLGNLRMDCVSQ